MEKLIKIIALIILFIIITYMVLIIFITNNSYASQTSDDINGINDSIYPGIKSKIQGLKNEHPEWDFKIYYTGLDWSQVIMEEFSGHAQYARNQIQKGASYQGDWICPVCKDYNKAGWCHASILAIQYMMDPRNSLDDTSIFQFEELTNSGYDINAINTMISGTCIDGQAKEIVDSANQTGINPYYIIAKILQEQGSGSVLVTGKRDYYNPFNIGAAGSTSSEDIENGLKYAKEKGWDSLTKGIVGGISFINSHYINRGQNTIYFQKFDVNDQDGSLYQNQYMQNVMGAENEGRIMRKSYASSGIIYSKHTFIIPVYENMPSNKCLRPSITDTNANVTTIIPEQKLYKINSSDKLRIRIDPRGDTIDWISPREIVTLIEKTSEKINGTYWDKIQTATGLKGYIARETYEYETTYKLYLVPIN